MRNIIAIGALFVLMMAFAFGLNKSLDGSATASPLVSHTTVIAENLVIGALSPSVTTAFLPTDDCDRIVVFVDATAGVIVRAQPSVDDGAIDSFAFTGATASKIVGQSVTYFSDALIAPEMAIEFERSNAAVPTTINKAWLFCAHT
jgi:hypothetical protein